MESNKEVLAEQHMGANGAVMDQDHNQVAVPSQNRGDGDQYGA